MSIVHSHCFLSNCEKKIVLFHVTYQFLMRQSLTTIRLKVDGISGLVWNCEFHTTWLDIWEGRWTLVWYGMVYVWALLNEFSERQTVTKCLGQARGVIMVIEEKRTKRVWAPQKDLRTGHFLRKWNYYILWIYVTQNH